MSKLDIFYTLAVGVLAGWLLAVLVSGFVARVETFRLIPVCQKDQVLLGVGSFKHGCWTSYDCGPSVVNFPENVID